MVLPPGMAKRIPAGWRLVFVIHYTTTGTAQSDQTRLGLTFAAPATCAGKSRRACSTTPTCGSRRTRADHRVEKSWQAPADLLLLAMFPHMHLRGKSFRYEAAYPDGTSETLLFVPRYDFNWQNRYVLAKPKQIPAGTTLRCIAHYDNSAANPANPDPNATVHTGKQSSDEMFNGYFDVALADQDLTQPVRAPSIAPPRWVCSPLVAALGLPLDAGRLQSRPAFRPSGSRALPLAFTGVGREAPGFSRGEERPHRLLQWSLPSTIRRL